MQIGDLKLSKELKEKLIGSDREGLGLGLGLGIGLVLGSDRRSEPNTVLWETTRHNRHNGLQTCYGEIGVMEFDLNYVVSTRIQGNVWRPRLAICSGCFY